MDESTLTDPDGVEIFYRRWLPEGQRRGVVLGLHGPGAAASSRLRADPMCGDGNPVTAGFVAGLLALLLDATRPGNVASIAEGMPVLLVTGEADPVSSGRRRCAASRSCTGTPGSR